MRPRGGVHATPAERFYDEPIELQVVCSQERHEHYGCRYLEVPSPAGEFAAPLRHAVVAPALIAQSTKSVVGSTDLAE